MRAQPESDSERFSASATEPGSDGQPVAVARTTAESARNEVEARLRRMADPRVCKARDGRARPKQRQGDGGRNESPGGRRYHPALA